jgi:hypothetical protein
LYKLGKRCGIISQVFTRDQFTVRAEKLFADKVSKGKESHFMQQQIHCHFFKATVTKNAHVKQNVFRKSVNAKFHMLDIHGSVHHDIIYENDQQDSTL